MNRSIKVWAIAGAGLVALSVLAYQTQRGGPSVPAGADVQTSPSARAGSEASKSAPAANAAANAPAPVVSVEAVKAATTRLVDDLAAVGSVRSNESVVLRPEISGRVAAIRFREGQHVQRGQVLVQLDDSIPRAELQQANAQLSLARSNYERTVGLAKQNFVSESARDQAASTLKVQEAAVALAETKLAKLAIRAPFDGTVGVRQIAVGDYVKEGQEMVAIEDSATVKVDFRVPERYLARVRPGQRFTTETDALPGRTFDAQVELVDPQVDAQGRSVLVRGRVPNAQGLLRPGMFARVRLIFGENPNAVLVPEEAIVPAGKSNFVYKIADERGQSVAVRTSVETGLRREGRVEVRQGVGAGDLVVTAGQIKLRGDRAPVRVVDTLAKAAPAAS